MGVKVAGPEPLSFRVLRRPAARADDANPEDHTDPVNMAGDVVRRERFIRSGFGEMGVDEHRCD